MWCYCFCTLPINAHTHTHKTWTCDVSSFVLFFLKFPLSCCCRRCCVVVRFANPRHFRLLQFATTLTTTATAATKTPETAAITTTKIIITLIASSIRKIWLYFCSIWWKWICSFGRLFKLHCVILNLAPM